MVGHYSQDADSLPKLQPGRVRTGRTRFNSSNLLQNRVQMLTQRLLDQRFAANGVVVNDNAITSNIEGQFLAALCEKNRWLVERVGVADLIIDILIRRRD